MNKQFDRYDTTGEYVQGDVTKWRRHEIVFSNKDAGIARPIMIRE